MRANNHPEDKTLNDDFFEEGIEFENVTTNITLLFPKIWDKLKIEERRALGDTFVEYDSKNDTKKLVH